MLTSISVYFPFRPYIELKVLKATEVVVLDDTNELYSSRGAYVRDYSGIDLQENHIILSALGEVSIVTQVLQVVHARVRLSVMTRYFRPY